MDYLGQGPARGFELDLYDGELLLGGDSLRLVVARKIPNSETGVIQKTVDPVAFEKEKGGLVASLRQERKDELFRAFMQEARKHFTVERHTDTFKRVMAS